ncbi:hypothetical protein EGW08_004479, partial [Elysia chlorotica]
MQEGGCMSKSTIEVKVKVEAGELRIECTTQKSTDQFNCTKDIMWCEAIQLYVAKKEASTVPFFQIFSREPTLEGSPYRLICHVQTDDVENTPVFWVLRTESSSMIATDSDNRHGDMLEVTDVASGTGKTSVLTIKSLSRELSGMEIQCFRYDFRRFGYQLCEQEPSLCTDRTTVYVQPSNFRSNNEESVKTSNRELLEEPIGEVYAPSLLQNVEQEGLMSNFTPECLENRTNTCEVGWYPAPDGKTCVIVSDAQATFSNARIWCSAFDGDLVRIPNEAMNTFLVELTDKLLLDTRALWIGLNNQGKTNENNLYWNDDKNKAVYLYPNISQTVEDEVPQICMTFTPLAWQAKPCGEFLYFICQRDHT